MPISITLPAGSILWIAALLATTAAASGQSTSAPIDPGAAYEKYEHMIPMRDGAKLYTAVYVPKDASNTFPILLCRTRYGVRHYGPQDFHPPTGLDFYHARYIVVKQEVRGSFLSEGTFVDMTPQIEPKRGPADVDQSTDCYDTVDWLVKNVPRNNGRVGLWGISYDGFFAAAGMIDAHPALVAVSPQSPQADWFGGDDLHMHGAFILADTLQFASAWGQPRPEPTTEAPQHLEFGAKDGYQFYLDAGPIKNLDQRYLLGTIPSWKEWMVHGAYDDFWKARNILPHLRDIRPAVMNVSGWYDANNLYGALNVYRMVEKTSPDAFNILVIGPWSHGQWDADAGESLGDVSFGSKTAPFYRDNIEIRFFDAFLSGGGESQLPEAYVFETGNNRWRTFEAWPPRARKTHRSIFGKTVRFRSNPHRPAPLTTSLSATQKSQCRTSNGRLLTGRRTI